MPVFSSKSPAVIPADNGRDDQRQPSVSRRIQLAKSRERYHQEIVKWIANQGATRENEVAKVVLSQQTALSQRTPQMTEHAKLAKRVTASSQLFESVARSMADDASLLPN